MRKVLWPLLVWSSTQLIITTKYEGFISPGVWLDGTYQWFLVVLMACFLIAPVTRWIPCWLVAMALITTLVLLGPELRELHRILFFGAFFFLGGALAR